MIQKVLLIIIKVVSTEESEKRELELKLSRIIEQITDYCDADLPTQKSPAFVARSNSRSGQSSKKSSVARPHPQYSVSAAKKLSLNGAVRTAKQ